MFPSSEREGMPSGIPAPQERKRWSVGKKGRMPSQWDFGLSDSPRGATKVKSMSLDSDVFQAPRESYQTIETL